MAEIYTTERIVQEFMDVTVKELRHREETDKECREHLRYMSFITDDIVSKEHLSAEKIQDMTYTELICLIDQVGDDPRYDGKDQDSISRQFFYYLTLARALIEAGVLYNGWVSEPVERFSKLSLKKFYAYLESVSDHEDLPAEFAYIKNCCEYRDYYTVGDFLSEKSWISRRAWNTTESLEEYGKKIRDAQKDIGRLLVDSFHLAFPDRFHVTDICSKYHDSVEAGGEVGPFEKGRSDREPVEPFHQAFADSRDIMADCNDYHRFADRSIDGENSPYIRLLPEDLPE